MNERIRELAERAGFQYIKDEGIGWAGNYDASLPKFAELIVRECAEVLLKEMNRLDALDRVVSAQTLDTAQVLIKNHFGVEE